MRIDNQEAVIAAIEGNAAELLLAMERAGIYEWHLPDESDG